jgi:hypothetical protein
MFLPPPSTIDAWFRREGFILVSRCLASTDAATLAMEAADLFHRFAVTIAHGSGADSLRYSVVTGTQIEAMSSSLFQLYTADRLLDWIRDTTHCPDVRVSPHRRSSINLNRFNAVGQRYPWHRDAVPFTAILFLTTMPSYAGGELVVRSPGGTVATILPTAGDLILMDGARCRHAVRPLRAPVDRITMPMVYPACHVERPNGLDEFLYQQ